MRDSVPSARYSSVFNVLHQWSISRSSLLIESTDSMIKSVSFRILLKMQKNSSGLGVVTCDVQEGQEVFVYRRVYIREVQSCSCRSEKLFSSLAVEDAESDRSNNGVSELKPFIFITII